MILSLPARVPLPDTRAPLTPNDLRFSQTPGALIVDDDRVVKLLEEIRDLQRLHVENYKDALQNQQESIRMNKEWQRKASLRQVIALIVIAVVIGVFLWPYVRR
jgi:hypothetical protein